MNEAAPRPSYRLTFEDALEIWRRYWSGDFQHRIAADFDVNPGRVNEVLKGKRWPGSEAAAAAIYRKRSA
jgi:hypothetical protein